MKEAEEMFEVEKGFRYLKIISLAALVIVITGNIIYHKYYAKKHDTICERGCE